MELSKIHSMMKECELSKKEKVEYALISGAGLIMSAILMYVFHPVFAGSKGGISGSDIADLVKTVIKVICYVVGALFAVIGIVKLAIAHADDSGPEQKKAVMMIATGGALVALGGILVDKIKASWFTF